MTETLQKKLKYYRCELCNHMKVEIKCCLFQWIGSVLGDKVPNQDFETVLKDGTILCRLMNKIQPGSIKKFRETVVFSIFSTFLGSYHDRVVGHSLHADGEHPGLSQCRQEVWSPRRGAVSDRWLVWEEKPSPGQGELQGGRNCSLKGYGPFMYGLN